MLAYSLVFGELRGYLSVFGRNSQEDTPEDRRIRASMLAHERGSTTKVASALISPPAAPRDRRTPPRLSSKHPIEDPAANATRKAQAEQRAGITAVGEQEQQSNVTSEPLDAQGQIPEVENLFEEATVKAVIKKANPRSAAGPSVCVCVCVCLGGGDSNVVDVVDCAGARDWGAFLL